MLVNFRTCPSLTCVLLLKTVFSEPLSPVEFESPLDVYVRIFVESISDPRPSTMDFEMEIVLQIYWDVKPLLCKQYFNGSFLQRLMLRPPKVNEYIHIPSNKMNNFWIPDLYYVEATNVVQPSVISVPRSLLFYNNGPSNDCRLVLRSKETVTIGCNLNFKMYPLDVNKCDLNMRSFTYPKSSLRLHWKSGGGLLINPQLQSLVCRLQITFDEAFNEWYNMMSEGNYDGIRMTVKFSRTITNQLINTYIPSILLVLVGFSCFWISVDAGGERITLTITTLLAVYTQITQVRMSIPPTSYLTNIDIWLFATLGFNLLSALQCAFIQGIQFREQKKLVTDKQEQDHSEQSRWRHGPLDATSTNHDPVIKKQSSLLTRFQRSKHQSFTEYCDEIGKFLLIGSFMVFFISYTIYMTICYVATLDNS